MTVCLFLFAVALGFMLRQGLEANYQQFDFYGHSGRDLLLCVAAVWISFFFAGCTISANRYKPTTDFPDASTPVGLRVPGTTLGQDENNGGIIDDITLNGRAYSLVTPNLAAKIQKWQGNQNGFVKVDYKDHADYFVAVDGVPVGYFQLWAIDKGTISAWVHAAN